MPKRTTHRNFERRLRYSIRPGSLQNHVGPLGRITRLLCRPNIERQSQTSVFVDDFLDRFFKCDLRTFFQWQSKDTLGNFAHLSP